MEILYSKKAARFISSLDRPTKQRIRKAIEGLTQTPPLGDIKKMQGFSDGRMRLKVGGYRIIYNYGNEGNVKILFVFDIGSRGDIYK